MQKKRFILKSLLSLFLVLGFLITLQSCKKTTELPSPPETNAVEVLDNLHGTEIADSYRWLEDQESPETREWINAQNAHTDLILTPLPGREELKELLTKLIRIDTLGMPTKRAGRYFFHKRNADQELSVIYMREGLRGDDQVLIDPHPMSEDKTTSVMMYDVSEDGTLMAYGVREGGADEIEIRLYDVEARKDLPYTLPKARYFGFSFTPDKKACYYTRHTTEGSRVYYHEMEKDFTSDQLIFGEGYGPEMILWGDISENGDWLVITIMYGSAAEKTEIYLKDLTSEKPIFPVVKDINARFYGGIADDTMFLQTNWEAPNGRLLAVDLNSPAKENWREVIPETDAVIQGSKGAGGKIFISYLKDVNSKVVIFEQDGTKIREISFPTIGTVSNVIGRWKSNEAFYLFTSFHIPTTIYRYEVDTGNQEVWSKINVPIESDKYEVKQVWFVSKDSTQVPMFIVHSKDIKLDGSNPTLLTGYGGFNASYTPFFSAYGVAWIDKGGVYALSNLRGGGEFGEEWHKAGMREKKQNVFDDFIAAAEYLIEQGYTRSEKLAIEGSSNGGLLVGAAMNQRPDLFGAVVCTYPLLDMIRYHKFLLAKFWVSEYGSSENEEEFKYLYAYSPYHNVKKGTKYPAMLFITGDADTRVAPLHARKMTALMQASTGSEKPILLRYHSTAGHSGGQPLSEQIEDVTEGMIFLLWQLGEIK